MSKRLAALCVFLLFVCASKAQTPIQKAAAVLSGEQPATALKLSTKDATAAFAPLLKGSPNSSGFVVAAFALAMSGVDIDANIGRLIIPIKNARDEKIEELTESNGLAENQIMLADIPNGIYMIYKTRKHLPALKALLSMPIEWPAAEYRDDCILAQIRKDPKPIFQMAGNDKNIYNTLWDIVDWNIGSPTERKVFINRLQTAKWTTAPMKKAAMQLSKDLQKPKNRPSNDPASAGGR